MWIYLIFTDWRHSPARTNLDNENSNSLLFDEGDLVNNLDGLLPPNYIQPSVKQPPSLIPAGQSPANTGHGNGIEQIVNGAAREWDSNLSEPITFPLQQKTAQPQSTPSIYISEESIPLSLVEGSFENKNFAAEPSHGAASSHPSFQSWQVAGSPFGSLNQQRFTSSSLGADLSKPVLRPSDNSEDPLSSGFNMLGFSSTPTKNVLKLEQVSNNYPSVSKRQRPAFLTTDRFGQGNDIFDIYGFPFWKPSFQGPLGGLPYHRDWMGFPFSGFGDDLYYGQMALQPQNVVSNTGKYWIPQMSFAQRFTMPAATRKNFVVRSKSGYQRRRLLQSKTTYVPGFEMPPKQYTPEYKALRNYRRSPNLFRGPAKKLIRRPVQHSIPMKI